MFEKMTPNQRLMVAIGLSIVFFVVYTAIFPPKEIQQDNISKNSVELKDSKVEKSSTTLSNEELNHKPITQEKIASSDIVVVKANDFILKIDTLGRISSKELLEEKYNTKDGRHAQMIKPFSTKPLFIRFLDEDLNKEAKKVPYTASVKEISLVDGKAKKVTLTQKLSNMTVTKELTFYADGHYDAVVKLSKDKRYFIFR